MARGDYERLSPADDRRDLGAAAGRSCGQADGSSSWGCRPARCGPICCGAAGSDLTRGVGRGPAELGGTGGDLPGSGRGQSLRAIAAGLGAHRRRSAARSPATAAVAGTAPRARTSAAWARATRPKACKLATQPGAGWHRGREAPTALVTPADRRLAEADLPRRPRDAGVAREHLPHAVRAVARRAAQGADRLPAHRPGDPTPARGPAARWSRRPARDRCNISERPAEAEDRAVPGHWEGDLVFGKQHEPGRHPGRTLDPIPDARRAARRQPQGRRRRRRPGCRGPTLPEQLAKSLTWDQGHEMAQHQRFTIATGDAGLLLRPQVSPGSAAATRTPTGCCASTCPADSTSAPSPKPTSTPSPRSSTNDLDRPSASRHHHKH